MQVQQLILQLKSKIQNYYSIPIDQQRRLLNNVALQDERTLGDYDISPGTKIILTASKHLTHKAMQDSIVNNTKKVSDKLRNEMSSIPKHLQNITSNSQQLIQTTANMSSLRSLKRDTSSQISVEISELLNQKSISLRSFGIHEAMNARNAIYVNHANEMKEHNMGRPKCMDKINQITNEMREIQERIDSFQKERKRLQDVKYAKHAFHGAYYKAYKQLDQSVRNKNLSVECAFRDWIQFIHEHVYDAQLKPLIEEKRMFLFEKEYKTWNNDNTIAWIQSIEDGYFEDQRFEGFMNTMKDSEIDGRKLHTMNNRMLLQHKGMEEKKDQDILMKHIDRIVVHQNNKDRRV
eukprot:806174_1